MDLRPSDAGRWAICHASVFLREGCPEGDKEYAEEGNAGHWVGEKVLKGCHPSTADMLGMVTPNGFTVTGEMAEAVGMYVEEVQSRDVHRNRQVPRAGGVEEKMHWHLSDDHKLAHLRHINTLSGTADAWRLSVQTDPLQGRLLLTIFDLKYGWVIVEPVKNKQLSIYAAAKAQELGLNLADIDVELVIVQPRPPHRLGRVRRWQVSGDVVAKIAHDIENAVGMICSNGRADSPAVTGNHCRNCEARLKCPALHAASMEFIRYSTTGAPFEMTPEEMVLELGIVTGGEMLLKQRRLALEAQVAQLLKTQRIPGAVISETLGNRKLVDGAEKTLGILAQMCGIKITEEKLLSPAGMEAAGMSKKLVNKYTTRPTSHKLTLGDNSELAKLVFKRPQG